MISFLTFAVIAFLLHVAKFFPQLPFSCIIAIFGCSCFSDSLKKQGWYCRLFKDCEISVYYNLSITITAFPQVFYLSVISSVIPEKWIRQGR